MTRVGGAVLAALLAAPALVGCGPSDPAAEALQATAARLGEVRSGALQLEIAIEGSDGSGRTAFGLDGPFALAEDGGLPVADLVYTQAAGDASDDVRFLADGNDAWIEVDGAAYAVPEDQLEGLRAGGGSGEGPLARLRLAEWIVGGRIESGEPVGDAATQRVTGELDVPVLLADLSAFTADVGAEDAVAMPEGEAEMLRTLTRTATLELLTGVEDRLLHQLRAEIVLERDAPLADLPPGARFTMDLELRDHGSAVEVTPPADARPLEELPTG